MWLLFYTQFECGRKVSIKTANVKYKYFEDLDTKVLVKLIGHKGNQRSIINFDQKPEQVLLNAKSRNIL